jgi:hypothetical protein
LSLFEFQERGELEMPGRFCHAEKSSGRRWRFPFGHFYCHHGENPLKHPH